MDYSKTSAGFKIKKVARYLRLYGASRTYIKTLGQRHMKKRYAELPALRKIGPEQTVGLIGCGNYAFTNIAYFLKRRFGRVIGACMDIDIHRAASLASHYGAPFYTDNAKKVIENTAIKLVYIASNHASHAEYAIEALEAGKHVYIEKPHVVSEDQLRRLQKTSGASKGKVFLGFNRPHSPFGDIVREQLQAQAGPAVYNWFIAGHAIPADHWYYKPEEGGRVLGNLCHWTDFVLRLEPGPSAYPIVITPTRAEKSDCDIAVTYTFGNGTIAAITFSAKGDPFEGIRERFSAHKGDCIITMDDFQSMRIDVGARRTEYSRFHRDQGHERNITAAFESVKEARPYDGRAALDHAWSTARLFLVTQKALECNEKMTIERGEAA
jgi:predicted dehydrogenase